MADNKTPPSLDSKNINLSNERLQLNLDLLKEQLHLEEDINKKKEIGFDIDKLQLRQLEEEITLLEKEKELDVELIKQKKQLWQQESLALSGKIELFEKEKELQEEILGISRNFNDEISKTFGLVTDINQTGFGKMNNLIEKSGNLMAAVNNVSIELSKNLGTRIIASFIEKGQEMFLVFFEKLDEMGAHLEQAIPNGRKFESLVLDINAANKDGAVSLDSLSESIVSLNTHYADFNTIGKDQQKQLIVLSATLNQLGVSTEEFAQNSNFLTKSMGMTTNEVVQFQDGLNELAAITHKSMGTLNKDFEQASKKLAGLGKSGAIKAFNDLEKASRALGIETNRLLDISTGFDTFETAAEAAGSLNSVLGGNLINTIDLMNASLDSPIEVFKQFKTALDKTGKSVTQMTNAQQKMIAETMHMDVSELRSLSEIDLEDAVAQMEASADSAKSLSEQAKAATPALEKLQRIFYKFATFMEPLIDKLNSFVDWLSKISANPIVNWIGSMLPLLGALAFSIGLAGKSLIFLNAAKIAAFGANSAGFFSGWFGKGGVKEVEGITKFTQGLSEKVDKVGKTASSSATGMLAFGAAILMIGGGIAIAAYGLSLFVAAFSGMSPDQIYAVAVALGVFGVTMATIIIGLAALAPALAGADIPLLGFGAAILLVGSGIGIAAFGMSKLVGSFSDFMAIADLGKLATLYIGVNGLALAFTSLAGSFFALGLAAPNLIAFGLAVRIGITDAVIEKLQQVAEYMTMISNGLENMKVENLTALANAAASMNLGDINARLATATAGPSSGYSEPNIIVNIPEQTLKIEINAPIMLNGSKIGEFVQDQIVKREGKQVPGSIQHAVGIRTGNYND